MADVTRIIEILFKGTNKVGSTIMSVNSDLDNLNSHVASVAQPFATLTSGVIKLDAALAGLAAAGIAIAYSESSKLQSSFTELKKVAGDNSEMLGVAKVDAKELSNAYGESAASVLSSTASYKQAGFDIQGAMTLAKDGMDLVIAGELQASASSEILIASLKGFKAPAEDARRLIDILNEVSNNYATDIEQLGRGMAGISPIALKMGFSMEETAGVITPVIEVFRSGDEASVALKTGLLKLIDDSKPVQEALASIGVSQRDSNGQLRSGKDILYDVAKAFQTIDEPQKLFVTQQLVGIEQSARMVEVFDGLSKSSEITAVAMNAAGSAAKEVAERLKDPEVAVNRLIQGFKNLASTVGDDFQEAGTDAINGITAILNALEHAADEGAFEPLLDALNDFLDDVEEALGEIAENLPEALENVDYSELLDSLGKIRDIFGELFSGIDLSSPESLARTMQTVVDTITSLMDMSGGIAEVFVTVAGHIGTWIEKFNNLDADSKAAIGNVSGIGSIVSKITGPIGSATEAIQGMGGALKVIAAGSVASNPVLLTLAGIGTATYGIVKGTDAVVEKLHEWIGTDEKLEEANRKALAETQAEVDRIWESYQKAKESTQDYGESAYDSNLKAVNSLYDTKYATEDLTEELRRLGVLVEEPKKVNVDTEEAKQKFQELEYWVGDVAEGPRQLKTIKVPVDASEIESADQQITTFYKTIEETRDGKKWLVKIPVDTTEIEKADKTIEDKLKGDLKLQVKLEIANIESETKIAVAEVKARSETIQDALKYKAEVDIAEIEAAAEVTTTLSNNITEMFANTGKQITDLYSQWDEGTSLSEKWSIQESLRAENETRERTLKMQEKLNDAQIKFLTAQKERMESGAPLITVTGDGLKPHLEMIMWELFESIQIRAYMEGLNALTLGGQPAGGS